MSRYASWGIIVDDIIFPDGRSAMGVLGGGGLYAAIGMRLWTPDVFIISAVGKDFDHELLRPHGLDDSGLLVTDLATPRAWQLFEENGRRTQIFRVPDSVWYRQLVLPPTSQTIPTGLQAAHFIGRGDPHEEEMILALSRAGVRLSAEPVVDGSTTPDQRASLIRCLAHFDFFSPNTEEAAVLVGEKPLKDQLRQLASFGPPFVALRQGAAGSVIYERETDRFWRAPAAAADVVDVTGAGNAYCGGFLTGLIETGDIQRAASMATVSAAIAIEQVGPPPVNERVMASAQRRAKAALTTINLLDNE